MPYSTPSPRENITTPENMAVMSFLRENLDIKGIVQAVRPRFQEINELLVEEGINRHDQGHQMRVGVNAAKHMRDLGFSHKEVILAFAASQIHDIGYNTADNVDTSEGGYLGGNKARFKNHALYGAIEAEKNLSRMLNIARKRGTFAELLSYKDENGETVMIDEDDIALIKEMILNHNDYGKDSENYHPEDIDRSALMVQLFDKLDHHNLRVAPEHMVPEAFVPEAEGFDARYYHRCVPFSIHKNEFEIDQETKKMRAIYHVDLAQFEEIVQGEYPEFEYGHGQYVGDFQKAYNKSCEVAAEAIGTVLGYEGKEPNLVVELRFSDGEVATLDFTAPHRTPKAA